MGLLGKGIGSNRLARSPSSSGDVDSLTALFEQRIGSQSKTSTGTPESYFAQQRRLRQKEQEELKRARHEAATFRLSIRGLALSLPKHLRESKSKLSVWGEKQRDSISPAGFMSKESSNPRFNEGSSVGTSDTPTNQTIPAEDTAEDQIMPANDTAENQIMPANDTAENQIVPAEDTAEDQIMPANDTAENQIVPANDTAENQIVPAEDTAENQIMPANDTAENQIMPANDTVTGIDVEEASEQVGNLEVSDTDGMIRDLELAMSNRNYSEAYIVAQKIAVKYRDQGDLEAALEYYFISLSFSPVAELESCYREIATCHPSSDRAKSYEVLASAFAARG